MKANQAFKANDEAVSPVIGVILMVAITVVLAAVVFVLVSNLSKNSNTSAPSMSFNQDKTGQTLTVVSADASADWKNIKIYFGSGTSTCTYSLNGGTASAAITTPTVVVSGGQAVKGGDQLKIAGCAAGANVMTLTYTTVNQLLGTWTFNF